MEDKVQRDFGILFKHIHDALYKSSNNRLRLNNLTLSQMGLLMNLEHRPSGMASMKELEQLLHVAQSTVVGIVSRLEQKEFVSSHEDAHDRRVKLVELTEKGGRTCEQAKKYMEQDQTWLLHGFDEAEKEQLYEFLQRVVQNVTDSRKK